MTCMSERPFVPCGGTLNRAFINYMPEFNQAINICGRDLSLVCMIGVNHLWPPRNHCQSGWKETRETE